MKKRIKMFEEFVSAPKILTKKRKTDIKKAVTVPGWKVY